MQSNRPKTKLSEHLQNAAICVIISLAGIGLSHVLADGLVVINDHIEQSQQR